MYNPSRRSRAALASLVGLIAVAWQLSNIWEQSFPPVPSPLVLNAIFPIGAPGKSEPIITTGIIGDGDFLAVTYLDERTAVFVYDVWGVGGPRSEPFELKPGTARTLQVTMPTLAHVSAVRSRETRPLRIVLDDREVLTADVFFHRRRPHEIYFGENPLGGTLVAPRFRGSLALPGGIQVRGGPASLFGAGQRIRWMATRHPGGIAAALAGSAVLGLIVSLLVGWGGSLAAKWSARSRLAPVFPAHPSPPHRAFALTTLFCATAFSAVITGGTFQLIHPESFGNFYDYQAASLLEGRLDVPAKALDDEAFIFEGKRYGYFGPTPALLRLPFTLAGIGFGQLSRTLMVADYVACLVAGYALLVFATRLATGRRSWPSALNVVLLTATTGLGSTLFFVSSRAYIYHEAIVCGAAFALWGGYCSLRFLAVPSSRWWIGALVCGVLSVHARPPAGLFALSMLGCAALANAGRARAARVAATREGDAAGSNMARWTRHLGIATLAGLGVLSFNGLSYLKFRTFEGAPLQYHVQYHSERLANFQGRNFHLGNIPHNAGAYLWRPNFEVRPQFPYLYMSGGNLHDFPTSRIDLAERVVALPYAMPALVAIALFGGVFAFGRWPAARLFLGVTAAASLPMTAALCMAIAVSQRYTGDWIPALMMIGAFGVTGLELLPQSARRLTYIGIALLAVASIFITVAITLHYQGEEVWGVPDDVKQKYQNLRRTVDGFFGLHS